MAASTDERLNIQPDWLPLLGTLSGPAGPLTPFFGEGGDMGAARAAMQRAGVIAADGSLAPAAKNIIDQLARARAMARVRFIGPTAQFEYMVYFPTDGSGALAVTNDAGLLRVQRPAVTGEVLAGLADFQGNSRICGLPFDLRLSLTEAVTLLALTDLQRRNSLARLAAGYDFTQVACAVATLAAEIALARHDGQSLLAALRSLMEDQLTPPSELLPTALAALAEQKIIAEQGGGYVLAGQYSLLANRMLIIDNLLLLDAARVTAAGVVNRVRSLTAQAGMTDMLTLEADGEQVCLKSLSPLALLTMANELLGDPNALAALEGNDAAAGVSPAAAASGDKCRKCGLPISATAKFCMECGAARQ